MLISKRLIFLSILLIAISGQLISQESEPEGNNESESESVSKSGFSRPNIIKINTLALAFKNISLVYERGIMPRLSVGLGIGYKYAGTEPTLFSVNNSAVGVSLDKIQGLSVTPNIRYYLRACDPSILEGFYGGVYFRYTGHKTSANFNYQSENNPEETYQADLSFRELGVGIEFGYQILVKERFSIDFLFFGPRYTNYKLNYNFVQPPSQYFLDDLSEYLNDVVDRFGADYNVNVEREGEAKASTSFSFANMRFGLSLGYAF